MTEKKLKHNELVREVIKRIDLLVKNGDLDIDGIRLHILEAFGVGKKTVQEYIQLKISAGFYQVDKHSGVISFVSRSTDKDSI